MTVSEIADAVCGEVIVTGGETEVGSFYAGDFLSRVMGKAPAGCCWFTIMANVNVAGVAVLADIKCIVLCEGVSPDGALTEKCNKEGISLIKSDLTVFDCCRNMRL